MPKLASYDRYDVTKEQQIRDMKFIEQKKGSEESLESKLDEIRELIDSQVSTAYDMIEEKLTQQQSD